MTLRPVEDAECSHYRRLWCHAPDGYPRHIDNDGREDGPKIGGICPDFEDRKPSTGRITQPRQHIDGYSIVVRGYVVAIRLPSGEQNDIMYARNTEEAIQVANDIRMSIADQGPIF